MITTKSIRVLSAFDVVQSPPDRCTQHERSPLSTSYCGAWSGCRRQLVHQRLSMRPDQRPARPHTGHYPYREDGRTTKTNARGILCREGVLRHYPEHRPKWRGKRRPPHDGRLLRGLRRGRPCTRRDTARARRPGGCYPTTRRTCPPAASRPIPGRRDVRRVRSGPLGAVQRGAGGAFRISGYHVDDGVVVGSVRRRNAPRSSRSCGVAGR